MRNAILTAKQVATLDSLCKGRIILGVGVGWNADEFRFLNADPRKRGRILDESIRVLRNLWTSERPSFNGEYYRYDDTLFAPKPHRPGGPPIWVGGNSEAAVQRAGLLGDGWHGDEVMPEAFAANVETIKRYASESGRRVDPSVRFTVDLFQATGQERCGDEVEGYYMGEEADIGMRGSFEAMVAFASAVSRHGGDSLRLPIRARFPGATRRLRANLRRGGNGEALARRPGLQTALLRSCRCEIRLFIRS